VAAYLAAGQQTNGGPIPFLSNVYAHPPKFTNDGAFDDGQTEGLATGAVIWLWTGPQKARRQNLQGSARGGKMYAYDLRLQCVLISEHRKAELADADTHTFLDALTTWIDTDKTAGSGPGGVVFSWGEGEMPGQWDMDFVPSWPKPRKSGAMRAYVRGAVKVLEYHGSGT
jgi:hypothetical protein